MNNVFKRKLQFTLPVLLLLTLLSFSSKRSLAYTLGLVVGFSIVLLILFLKTRKESKSPTYFQDERATMVAYKADSITLRVLIIAIALLFFAESTYSISNYISLQSLVSTLLYTSLVAKVGLFYYLEHKQ